MTIHKLGYCLSCSASYASDVVTDGLCPICKKQEDAVYPNIPGPEAETDPWRFSRAAMRERLGVLVDEDV